MGEPELNTFPRSFKTLEVGRAAAATLVVLYHGLDVLNLRGQGRHLFSFGYSGVDFFFVLSGFIIFYAHRNDVGKPHQLVRYLRKRITRIYPIYWVVFMALVTALFLFPGSTEAYKRDPWFLLRSFALLPTPLHPLLGVTWSLSFELAFYLAFGVAILNRRAGLAVGSLWLAAVLFGRGLSSAYLWTFLTDRHILEFAMGVGCALAYARLRRLEVAWFALAGILLFLSLGIANSYFSNTAGGTWDFYYGIASTLILMGCTVKEGRKEVSVPAFLLMLGAASYSIYLVHYPVMLGLTLVTGRLPWQAAYVLNCTVAVLAGVLFHKVVELPLQRLLGRQKIAVSPGVSRARANENMAAQRHAVLAGEPE